MPEFVVVSKEIGQIKTKTLPHRKKVDNDNSWFSNFN